MGDEILTGQMKWGIVICVLLVASSVSPVYAFSFSELIESIRGAIGLQTKPLTNVSVSAPDYLNTELGNPATISLSVNNEKGSATISVTGTAYLEGQEVDKILKSISMEKESSTKIVVYEIPPSHENVGEWKFDIEVKAENERGVDTKSVSKTVELISLPEIRLKIGNVKDTYTLARDSIEGIGPLISIENGGGRATINVNFVIKRNGQVIKTIPKTYELRKGEKFEETPYTVQLNKRENEGFWEFSLEASAENIAGATESSIQSSTNVTIAPILAVTRKLDRDKMRRGENLKVNIEIRNNGFRDALGVSFKDILPQNLKFVSGSKSWQGTIKEGEKKTLSYVVSPPKKGVYTFPKTIVYYDGVLVKGLTSKSNANTIKVFGIPNIEITRDFSKSEILKGDSTTITIKIFNTGDGIAKSVSFSDKIPAGVSVVSGNYSISKEDIQPGDTRVISYTVTVQNKGQYTFPSIVASYLDEVLDKSYQSTISSKILTVYGIPELTVTRVIDRDKMRRGENLQVTVSLENIGDADAITVKFTDTPPSVFSSVSGSKSWTRKIVEGETKTFSYKVKPSKKGDYTFPEVSVYYTGKLTKELSSKSNTNFITVFGIPELKLTREFSRDKILKGESTTVTIKISNMGDGIAKSASFLDMMPSGVYFSSGIYSITEVDIQPGETKTVSYTVTVSSKGQYTFPSINANHLDELLDKWYQPKISSKILTVYGIPKIEFVSPFGVSKGEVVGDTTTLYVTIKNSGDGIAKNVYFSYESLPSAFKDYSGSKSWSGTLNPGKTKYVEYSVLNDATGTYEVSEADTSYQDELGNPHSAKISPIPITILGSKLVEYGLEADFDDSWASKYVPELAICNVENDYWQSHSSHRPEWHYRVVIDKINKQGIIQFYAYWPDQYDWTPAKHEHDYEPIWIYFTFSGGNWKNPNIYKIKYSKCHSKVSEYSPSEFSWNGNHARLRLKSGHHAYDGGNMDFSWLDPFKKYHLDTSVVKLTDNLVDSWNKNYDNPFYESGGEGAVKPYIFKNPFNLDDCFKSSCSLSCFDDQVW